MGRQKLNLNWEFIREDYINHEKVGIICKRYNIGLSTLMKKAREQAWTKKDLEQIDKEAEIHKDLIRKKNQRRHRGELEKISNDIDRVRARHRELAKSSLIHLQALQDEVQAISSLDEKVDYAKKIAEASKVWIALERELYGLSNQTEINETDILMQMSDDPIKASEIYKKYMS
jgi:replicative superfamily II helicase